MKNTKKDTAITVNGVDFSEADIAALKDNAGSTSYVQEEPASGGWGSAPRVTAPGAAGGKIRGASVIVGDNGQAVSQSKIQAPNIQRFNKAAADKQLEELAASDKQAEELAKMSPAALHATVCALSRKVNRMEKLLKSQEGN